MKIKRKFKPILTINRPDERDGAQTRRIFFLWRHWRSPTTVRLTLKKILNQFKHLIFLLILQDRQNDAASNLDRIDRKGLREWREPDGIFQMRFASREQVKSITPRHETYRTYPVIMLKLFDCEMDSLTCYFTCWKTDGFMSILRKMCGIKMWN